MTVYLIPYLIPLNPMLRTVVLAFFGGLWYIFLSPCAGFAGVVKGFVGAVAPPFLGLSNIVDFVQKTVVFISKMPLVLYGFKS